MSTTKINWILNAPKRGMVNRIDKDKLYIGYRLTKVGGCNLIIKMGVYVMKKAGLLPSDRVCIAYDELNSRRMLIYKSDGKGYKMSKNNGTLALTIQATFCGHKASEEECSMHEVTIQSISESEGIVFLDEKFLKEHKNQKPTKKTKE